MCGLTRKTVPIMEGLINAKSNRASGVRFADVYERTGVGLYGVKG